jgi:septum formation protein
MQLILASASPRRAELLHAAGFAFQVRPADVDETPKPSETPGAYALRVARDKAHAVAADVGEGAAVLAADTVVVAGHAILGKPVDDGDARRMLKMLSGAVHDVHTAVVLLTNGTERAELVTTRVSVLPLSDHEIDWYVGTGETTGKAGAYAIQGLAARFIDRIDGSWSNVVGLPIATVYRMFKECGILGGSTLHNPAAKH